MTWTTEKAGITVWILVDVERKYAAPDDLDYWMIKENGCCSIKYVTKGVVFQDLDYWKFHLCRLAMVACTMRSYCFIENLD